MKNVTIISFYIIFFILINRIYLYFIFLIKTTNRKFHKRKEFIQKKKVRVNQRVIFRELPREYELNIASLRVLKPQMLVNDLIIGNF